MLPVAMAWPATAKTRRALPTCQRGAIRHKHEPFTYIPSFGDRTGLVPRVARSGCRVVAGSPPGVAPNFPPWRRAALRDRARSRRCRHRAVRVVAPARSRVPPADRRSIAASRVSKPGWSSSNLNAAKKSRASCSPPSCVTTAARTVWSAIRSRSTTPGATNELLRSSAGLLFETRLASTSAWASLRGFWPGSSRVR